MGLFSRIRGSSTHPSTTSQHRPTTPLPSQASGSIAEGEITPKAREKKAFSLWKGKGKADPSVAGRRYEDHSVRGHGHGHPNGLAGNRTGGPRQSGAWERDSIYSERPASPLDPPSRVWGQAAERQRSASASGVHPPSQINGYHADGRTQQSQFHSLRDQQYTPRSPDRQRFSGDMARIPPPSPSSIRTAPMHMPSNANRPYPSHPHFTGIDHFATAAGIVGDATGTNRIEIPQPPVEGGFLGKLTFEDKATRRTGLAQRREREPSWLVGSVDDGSGLFGFNADPSATSNSSLASSSEAMTQAAPQALAAMAAAKGAMETASPAQAAPTSPSHAKHAPVPLVSPVHISRAVPAPPLVTPSASSPALAAPANSTAAPPPAPSANLDMMPTPPPVSTAAPSAWKPEVVQAVAATTALPPSLPPSSMSSPVIEQDEDKKAKFWKGRGRRSSKAMSDMEHELHAPVESPASSTRPTDTSRPPELRRPSSSFFARPFNRVSSRTSVFDLESTSVDDKSFQLKGFRHVSGVSGLQDEANGDKDKAETIADNLEHAGDDWKPTPPTRPTMSRPTSAASVRTLDEMSASKVSVAAFKRGIRRPSETIDRADKSLDDDDEDDDVPLGMLNRSGIPRPASSASISRMASPLVASPASSTSPMPRPFTIHTNSYDLKSELASPDRNIGLGLPSSSPLSPKDGSESMKGARPTSGAFVVKSGKSTRSLHSVDSRDRDARSMRSVTPDNRSTSIPPRSAEQSRGPTRSTSPVSTQKSALQEEQEVIVSPAKPKATSSHKDIEFADGIEDTDAAVYIRSRAASPTPGPAMVPLGIPLPQESPSMAEMEGLNLPPRPDEIEEEPVSPRSANSTMSPRARISSVVDPLKRLSGFLSSTPLNKAVHGDDDGFDTSLALHGLMFAEQDSRCESATGKLQPVSSPSSGTRLDLQDRLNAIKPAVPRIQTDMPSTRDYGGDLASGQMDEQATPVVRTHVSALAGRLTPIASQEGSSREDLSSAASESRPKPFGPRDRPSTAAPVYPANDGPTIHLDDTDHTDQADNTDSADASDESSDEETLAQLKTRASRSTLNLSRPPPVRDDASSVGSSPRTARAKLASPSLNDLALGPVTSRMSSASSPYVPKMSISPSESTTFVRPGLLHSQSSRSSLTPSSSSGQAGSNLPVSPSGKSVSFADHKEQHSFHNTGTALPAQVHTQTQGPTSGTRGRMAYSMHEAHTSASPASSQSGLTGDSAPGPMTPGEGSVVSRSRERPGMSSSQSSFSLNEDRQRRFSQVSNSGASVAPSADPATLSMMKQQWQAQFMAAAYAASEEQWERASSVGTAADSAPQNGYFGQQPMSMNMPFGFQMPGMPVQNQQQMLGMGMPFGMQYPGMSMPMMAGMPNMGMPGMPNMGMPMGMQYPYGMMGQGMPGMPGMPGMSMPSSPQMGAGGMYSYGPGAQSVFGGEFGPPTGHRGHSSPDVRSVSASASGNGINGPSYVSSPLAQPPHGTSGSASRPSGSRHSRSTSNLRSQTASSVYGTASSGNTTHTTRPRHHSSSRSVTALPTIQQSPQKDSPSTPRQPPYGASPLRPGPRAASAASGLGDGARHSSYDLLSAPAPPPSSWRSGSGASEVSRSRPRTHYAS